MGVAGLLPALLPESGDERLDRLELDPGAVMVIDDPRENAERRERAAAQPS